MNLYSKTNLVHHHPPKKKKKYKKYKKTQPLPPQKKNKWYLNIRMRYLIDETAFPHIWVPCDQERPFKWVDRWQSGQMLPDFLQES